MLFVCEKLMRTVRPHLTTDTAILMTLRPIVPRVPIFGGGDCFSSKDYWSKVELSGVDGVMIGRGALIKPWIFTEIRERREWDISSTERLEGIRKVRTSFSPSHHGSQRSSVCRVRPQVRFPIVSYFRGELSSIFFLFSFSHFGSDTTGVNTTRRFLCEALSFQHRYVPIGLLEQLPGRINDRAPAFRGRNELGAFNPPAAVPVTPSNEPCRNVARQFK
jgi:tRNA-dihydrouridine synthase 3